MTNEYSRRTILKTAAGFGAVLGMPSLALAQTFPDKSKPIKGIVPSAAGSTVDTVARAYAQAMSEILGANVVIEARPGAEGVIGMQAVRGAAPDGYTMMFTSISTQVINPHLFKKVPYDALNDFVPLGGTLKSVLLMNAGGSTSFKTVKEFIDAAKAKPGKISYASISATTRLCGEMFAKAAGIKLLNVPYKSFSDLTADMISGRVDMFFADQPAVGPFYKQGMRSIAALSKQRSPFLPDVPTMEEQGIPGVEVIGWHGAYLPAHTPAPIVATLTDALRKATDSKYVKDYHKTFGIEALPLYGDDFAAFQRAEYEKWGKAVREAGMAGML